MSGLVRAELLKLRTTRVPYVLVLVLLVLTALAVVATIASASDDVLDDPGWRRDLLSSAGLASLFVFLLGMLSATSEYRHGTVTPMFLVTPVRWRVIASKLVTGPLVAVPLALAAVGVTIAIAAPWLAARGAGLDVGGDEIAARAGEVLLSAVLWAALGVAIGALVRNQVGAIVGTLAWFLVVEPLLTLLSSSAGRYLPGQALDAIGGGDAGGEDALSLGLGTLIALGYAAALGAAAILATERRDVS